MSPPDPNAFTELRERIVKRLPSPYTRSDLVRAAETAIREMVEPYADQIIVECRPSEPNMVDAYVPCELVDMLVRLGQLSNSERTTIIVDFEAINSAMDAYTWADANGFKYVRRHNGLSLYGRQSDGHTFEIGSSKCAIYRPFIKGDRKIDRLVKKREYAGRDA